MITAIRVGNFKAFAETQRIPVRPLTLIYGANSSGKSSVIHSLILARHAQETGDLDVHRTTVGGESVDLGGFRQFIHHRDVGRRMEWSAELDTSFFTGRMAELLAPVKRLTVSLAIGIAIDDQGRQIPGALPEIHAYEILGDGRSMVRMSKRRDGKLQLDRLDQEHPVFRVLSARVREKRVNRCYHLGVKGLACLWQPCGRNTLLEHRGGVAVIPGQEILGRNY